MLQLGESNRSSLMLLITIVFRVFVFVSFLEACSNYRSCYLTVVIKQAEQVTPFGTQLGECVCYKTSV